VVRVLKNEANETSIQNVPAGSGLLPPE
jgi:hypothetical protein